MLKDTLTCRRVCPLPKIPDGEPTIVQEHEISLPFSWSLFTRRREFPKNGVFLTATVQRDLEDGIERVSQAPICTGVRLCLSKSLDFVEKMGKDLEG